MTKTLKVLHEKLLDQDWGSIALRFLPTGVASAVCAHTIRGRSRVPWSRSWTGPGGRRGGSAGPHYCSISATKHTKKGFIKGWKLECTLQVHRIVNNWTAPCGSTHPDLDRGFPSVLQSWSSGCRCLRQKFKWHWSQVTRIISFCLQPPWEHLFVKI